MFPSISRAIPLTQVTTSFTATRAMIIAPVSAFTLKVNGQTPTNPTSVNVSQGDVVTATVTSPADYAWHDFYYYTIDGVPQTFAAVNKSLYSIHVNPDDAKKRWYLYSTPVHELTFNSPSTGNVPLNLGTKFDSIIDDVHVVLDPNSESVYFYNKFGIQLSKVTLPAAPIAYVKIPDQQTVVVLILGGQTYEIYLNGTTSGNSPFFAKKDYSEFTGDTSFVTMLPGEDLISYLRRSRAKKTIPPATCIAYNGTYLFAAGNGSVWIVDPSIGFNLLNTFDFDEYFLNITPLPDNMGAVLVTQSQKVYTVSLTGQFEKIYDGVAVWQPALFNGKIYIPDSEHAKLKVYNPATGQFEADIVLLEFSPSYTTVVDNKLYVCGHDNEKVLVFDSAMNWTELVFTKKVTWISVLDGTYIVSHWLKDYKILDVKDLFRVVEIKFRTRSGPVSHIGTSENIIAPLGSNEVYAYTPTDTWLWLNGKRTYSNQARGTLCVGGDYISINYAAKVPGKTRTTCVIGDTAYDYDVEAYNEVYYPRNIELQIEAPQALNVHTRSITLPKFFTACRMSVEYGVIKVNDAYYYGDDNVYPGDRVTVEINTRGNNALPIFTIGARQFVIPVSTNAGNIAPITSSQSNLQPGTPVNFEVEFGQLASQFDYIIPGYYDISVKKNNVNITGNYYQQFGKGDKLIIEFISSTKKYDVKDVYILGAVNYKFSAKNDVELLINYLDYGTITDPYARQLDTESANLTTVINSINVDYYKEPDIQFITGNLTIAGFPAGYFGNISVVGGDSYFVLNGTLITNTDNINVAPGDQLALARNVVNYFDVPVTVVQHLPTGDVDLYADQVIGTWGIVNKKITDITQADKNRSDVTNEISIGDVDVSAGIRMLDTVYLLNRPTARKIISANEKLDIVTKVNSTATALDLDYTVNQPMNHAMYGLEENWTLVAKGSTVRLIKSDPVDSSRPGIAKQYQSNRTIFESRQVNYFENVFNDVGSTVRLTKIDPINLKGINLVLDTTRILSPAKSAVTKQYQSNRTIFESRQANYFENVFNDVGSTPVLKTETIQDVLAANVSFSDTKNAKKISAAVGEAFNELVFAIDGSRSQHLDFKTEKVALAGLPVRHTDLDSIVDASKISSFLQTLFIVTSAEPRYNTAADLVDTLAMAEAAEESYSKTKSGNAEILSDRINIEPFANPGIDAMYAMPRNFITPIADISQSMVDLDHRWQGFVWPDWSNKMPAVSNDADGSITKRVPVAEVNKQQSIRNRVSDSVVQIDNILPVLPSEPTKIIDEYIKATPSAPTTQILNYWINAESPLKETKSVEVSVKEIPLYYADSFTKSRQSFDVSSELITTDQLMFNKFATSSVINTGLGITSDENKHYITLKTIYKTEQLNFVKPLPTQYVTYYNDPRGSAKFEYSFEGANNYVPVTIDYRPADFESATGVDMDYRIELVLGDTPISLTYEKETLSDWNSRINFQQERILGDTSAYIPMERYYLGSGSLHINSAAVTRDGKVAEFKLDYQRERPQYYYPSDRNVVEFDVGIIWDNSIEEMYGAFVTEADAVLAASLYQSFRPFLILDTDLWTYRVLVDTNLVCELPKGRYPIAWLLRGG